MFAETKKHLRKMQMFIEMGKHLQKMQVFGIISKKERKNVPEVDEQ